MEESLCWSRTWRWGGPFWLVDEVLRDPECCSWGGECLWAWGDDNLPCVWSCLMQGGVPGGAGVEDGLWSQQFLLSFWVFFHFYVVRGDGGITLWDFCPPIPHGTLKILRDAESGQIRTFLRRLRISFPRGCFSGSSYSHRHTLYKHIRAYTQPYVHTYTL